MLRISILVAIGFCVAKCFAQQNGTTPADPAKEPVDQFIPWLLNEDRQLRGIPFAEVILDTTGKHVLAVNAKNETDQRVIKQISTACDETMKKMNTLDSVIQRILRINEVSGHFEDTLRELLNSTPGLTCDFPHTAQDRDAFWLSRSTDCRCCKQTRFLSGCKTLRSWKPRQQFSHVLFRAKNRDEQSAR